MTRFVHVPDNDCCDEMAQEDTDDTMMTDSAEDRDDASRLCCSASMIDGTKHFIIESPHPSPLSAHRGFFGSKPFSQTNTYLTEHGLDPVDWGDLDNKV